MEEFIKNLEERLARIEKLLMQERKEVMNVKEVAMLLDLSEDRIRRLVSEKEIPYYKQGKNVHFRRSEVEKWRLVTRIATNDEVRSNAATYVAIRN